MFRFMNWLEGDAVGFLLVALLLTGGVAFWAQPATAAVVENTRCFWEKMKLACLISTRPQERPICERAGIARMNMRRSIGSD